MFFFIYLIVSNSACFLLFTMISPFTTPKMNPTLLLLWFLHLRFHRLHHVKLSISGWWWALVLQIWGFSDIFSLMTFLHHLIVWACQFSTTCTNWHMSISEWCHMSPIFGPLDHLKNSNPHTMCLYHGVPHVLDILDANIMLLMCYVNQHSGPCGLMPCLQSGREIWAFSFHDFSIILFFFRTGNPLCNRWGFYHFPGVIS